MYVPASWSRTRSVDSLSMSGDKELQDFLKQFGPSVIKGGVRTATRKSYTPMLRAARAKARAYAAESESARGMKRGASRWRLIATSLAIRQKTFRGGTVYTEVYVKPNKFKGRGRGQYKDFNAAPLTHLLEFGTSPHYMGKGSSARAGAGSGAMHPGAEAHPFLRPSFDENKTGAIGTVTRELRADIEKAAQREARRRMKKYGHA